MLLGCCDCESAAWLVIGPNANLVELNGGSVAAQFGPSNSTLDDDNDSQTASVSGTTFLYAIGGLSAEGMINDNLVVGFAGIDGDNTQLSLQT